MDRGSLRLRGEFSCPRCRLGRRLLPMDRQRPFGGAADPGRLRGGGRRPPGGNPSGRHRSAARPQLHHLLAQSGRRRRAADVRVRGFGEPQGRAGRISRPEPARRGRGRCVRLCFRCDISARGDAQRPCRSSDAGRHARLCGLRQYLPARQGPPYDGARRFGVRRERPGAQRARAGAARSQPRRGRIGADRCGKARADGRFRGRGDDARRHRHAVCRGPRAVVSEHVRGPAGPGRPRELHHDPVG